MSYARRLEFGNYTLKFGEKKVLLDLFEEVVMPSFFEMRYIRKLKDKGEYFFLDTKLVDLSKDSKKPVLGISGRIVKNTKLKRDQIFRLKGGLIDDKSELETAPSSTFLLILNNHRLILSKEVSGGPTIKNFQTTSQYCLNHRYKEFVSEFYDKELQKREKNPDRKKKTKKSFVEKNPHPTLRITPLSDSQNLRDFISRFKHIDNVVVKLLPTNHDEINNDNFWKDFVSKKGELNSSVAKAEFANVKEGLDSAVVYDEVNSAVSMGNSEISLKGYDKEGDTIRGNNDVFSLVTELDAEDIPKNPERAAKVKYNQFNFLVDREVIILPKEKKSTLDKIKGIFQNI